MDKGKLAVAHRPLLLILLALLICACSDPVPEDVLSRSRETPTWFDDAKLGIFIHWGPAAVPAFASGEALQPGELEEMLLGDAARQELPYAEWYLYSQSQPGSETAQYHAEHYPNLAYGDFGPIFEERVNRQWDPQAWADLFARTGAKYVVLVAKHHDGYTLWPSAVENPNRADWGSGRDLVGELADAVRARGMHFGIYYSTGLDWTFKLVARGDLVADVMRSASLSPAYADYVYDQITELTDRYQPDLLWADIGYPSTGRRGDLLRYYFSQVPAGTVNDRWAGVDKLGEIAEIPGGTWVLKALARLSLSFAPDPLADDPDRIGFKTAEYDSLPGIAPFKWESTRGLGASFAFNARESAADMLGAAELVAYLVDTVAKNGNLLINVGPDSYGRIPPMQQAPLLGLGDWMAINGEAVYGTRPWIRFNNQRGRDLRYTRTDKALYAIVYGAAEYSITIEQPEISWHDIEVLGGEVTGVERENGLLVISLKAPVAGPAVVVRFGL